MTETRHVAARTDELTRVCPLQHVEDEIELCPGPGCPFWEEGGAALPGGCMLERLGLAVETRPDLAHALVQIRRKLSQAVTLEDADEARSLFYRLVPRAREDVAK